MTIEREGLFDVSVHRILSEEHLKPETVFGCLVTIPGTSYSVKEETMYFPGKGKAKRKFRYYCESNVVDSLLQKSSPKGTKTSTIKRWFHLPFLLPSIFPSRLRRQLVLLTRNIIPNITTTPSTISSFPLTTVHKYARNGILASSAKKEASTQASSIGLGWWSSRASAVVFYDRGDF